MEHVIDTAIIPHALHGRHILRLLHHADKGMVPFRRSADNTWVAVTEVEAGIAEADLFFGLDDGSRQCLRLSRLHIQHMISKAHCRLGANARQCAKMLYEFCKGRNLFHLKQPRRQAQASRHLLHL